MTTPIVVPKTTTGGSTWSNIAGNVADNNALAPITPANTQDSGGGLVSTAMNDYQPERITVNPATDTVQGQLDTILNKSSPLMQTARTSAKQEANRRGLLNSSMAVGAGEQAVINTALPIAQSDATVHNQVNLANQSAANTFGLQKLAGEQNIQLQNLRGDQAERIANVEGTYRELLQTSASAAALYSGFMNNINQIMQNVDLDENSKQIAINENVDMLEAWLGVLGGINGLDLRSLLTFE